MPFGFTLNDQEKQSRVGVVLLVGLGSATVIAALLLLAADAQCEVGCGSEGDGITALLGASASAGSAAAITALMRRRLVASVLLIVGAACLLLAFGRGISSLN